MAIRRVFEHTQLIEINAHSLFSKWYSESGKQVGKLFAKIREFCEDEQRLVVVLIDEVESLTAARSAAMNGVEPSDSIRVVNALLTQLDRLKHYQNALIVTTSNITGAVDAAFVDRADIKLFVGYPGAAARYHILASCIIELMQKNIVSPQCSFLSFDAVDTMSDQMSNIDEALGCSALLYEAARRCDGCSGRTLRKLPFLTVALTLNGLQSQTTPQQFIHALIETIARIKSDESLLN